jgi:hypothetical protein
MVQALLQSIINFMMFVTTDLPIGNIEAFMPPQVVNFAFASDTPTEEATNKGY